MMGADLYIESNYNALQARLQPQFVAAVKLRDAASSTKGRDEAQAEVERLFDEAHPPTAYFRDAYNSHCLLAQLGDDGLSWWTTIAPRLSEDDHLPLKDVQWLLDEVRNRRLTCQTSPKYEQQVTLEVMTQVAGGSVQVDQRVVYTADDVEWFVSRKQALITFLKTAVELGEPPVCSL